MQSIHRKLYCSQRRCRIVCRGEVAEWLMAPVLKTGVPERVPGVRIPPSPPVIKFPCHFLISLCFLLFALLFSPVRYRSAKVLIGEARLGQIGRVLQFSSCNGLEEIDGLRFVWVRRWIASLMKHDISVGRGELVLVVSDDQIGLSISVEI